MKILIVSLILAISLPAAADCVDEAIAAAAKAPDGQKQAVYNKTAKVCGERTRQCYTRIVTSCPIKKPVPVLVVPKPVIEYRDQIVEKQVRILVPAPTPPPRTIKVMVPVLKCPDCPPEDEAVVGGHVALGIGAHDPYVSGVIGVRFRFPKAYLGFEAYSALQYGVGLVLLPYVYQGPIVKVHVLDPGILIAFSSKHLLGADDVPRYIDLTLGAGVEVKLTCNLALTVDYRVGIPDPKYLADHRDCRDGCGKRLDVDNVIANAFASSQIFAGILLHN